MVYHRCMVVVRVRVLDRVEKDLDPVGVVWVVAEVVGSAVDEVGVVAGDDRDFVFYRLRPNRIPNGLKIIIKWSNVRIFTWLEERHTTRATTNKVIHLTIAEGESQALIPFPAPSSV